MNGHRINKEKARERQERMRQIGVVFQGSALFDSLTVWENVGFSLLQPPSSLSKAKVREITIEKLAQVGLAEETADLYPDSLSGGMKRRVALARAIVRNPSYLFLDEPTAGLDPVFSRRIGELIRTCQKELNATTLTITHDLELAQKIADKVGLLYEGKIAWMGSPQELLKSDHPIVQEFVGLEKAS